jgi:nucleotide-binding universal stress UspA family protein
MKILVAVDNSPFSQAAVDEVARRPWPSGTTIRVLSVFQPYVPPVTEFSIAAATMEEIRAQEERTASGLTSRAADVLNATGWPVETVVLEGEPRAVIVDEAAKWEADLIVVGSHGRSGLKRWLLGSVAQSIVAHAPCSVEVVRRRKPAR